MPVEHTGAGLRVLVELGSVDLRIGAVNDALDLAELIDPQEARFLLCGPTTPAFREEAARRGADTLAATSRTFSRKGLPLYAIDVLRWMRRLAALRPDVVHLNYAGYGPSLACAARLCGLPVVTRAGPFVPSNPSNRWTSAFVGNCRAHVAELLASPLARRVVVTGDLYRPGRLAADAAAGRPLPPRGHARVRLVFLGQLVERKGLAVLLEAMARVSCDIELLMAGGDWQAPGYPQELKALAASLGLGARLHFENHRTDVGALLRTADIFVLPSLSEARPRSIIEAMSLGLPVVATTAGGIPSLVDHGETGLLAPPGDVAALATAISLLAESPQLRAQMGQAGRRRADRDCRADETARAYLRLYQRLAAPVPRLGAECSGEL